MKRPLSAGVGFRFKKLGTFTPNKAFHAKSVPFSKFFCGQWHMMGGSTRSTFAVSRNRLYQVRCSRCARELAWGWVVGRWLTSRSSCPELRCVPPHGGPNTKSQHEPGADEY